LLTTITLYVLIGELLMTLGLSAFFIPPEIHKISSCYTAYCQEDSNHQGYGLENIPLEKMKITTGYNT